jgi:nucleotide-binding universal stress UspA family protein
MNKPLSNLLVVVNGSESSVGAVKYALALGKAYDSKVTAAYVVDTATIRQLSLSRIFVPDESAEYEESLEGSGRRILAYALELAQAAKVPTESLLLKGAIAGEIIKAAEDRKADCILIGGSERNSQFKSVLMDVYLEIVRNSPCPVLVVKGPQAEELFRSIKG